MGARLAYSSFHTYSDLKKGIPADHVTNTKIHAAQAISAAGLGISGLLLFAAPAVAPLLLIPSIVGVVGSFAVRHAIGGYHWINYPDKAPYPLNKILMWFKNDERFYHPNAH
mgnify:CR=1 FL=1